MKNVPFQNRVLLLADNLSDITKKYLSDELHYAILLIGDPVVWRQRQWKVVESENEEPCGIVDRAQPCIVYSTLEDYENNIGTYWPDIPDNEQEVLYEYTAKIV